MSLISVLFKSSIYTIQISFISFTIFKEVRSLPYHKLFAGMEEFWLGGNDLETEGHWVWSSSGTALDQHSYTNWGREPRHTIGQNCMSMLRGFVWAAEACFYQRYPFCELKLT